MEVLTILLSLFLLTYLQRRNGNARFLRIAFRDSRADWDGDPNDHIRDVARESIFNLNTSAADIIFCECVQVGINV